MYKPSQSNSHTLWKQTIDRTRFDEFIAIFRGEWPTRSTLLDFFRRQCPTVIMFMEGLEAYAAPKVEGDPSRISVGFADFLNDARRDTDLTVDGVHSFIVKRARERGYPFDAFSTLVTRNVVLGRIYFHDSVWPTSLTAVLKEIRPLFLSFVKALSAVPRSVTVTASEYAVQVSEYVMVSPAIFILSVHNFNARSHYFSLLPSFFNFFALIFSQVPDRGNAGRALSLFKGWPSQSALMDFISSRPRQLRDVVVGVEADPFPSSSGPFGMLIRDLQEHTDMTEHGIDAYLEREAKQQGLSVSGYIQSLDIVLGRIYTREDSAVISFKRNFFPLWTVFRKRLQLRELKPNVLFHPD